MLFSKHIFSWFQVEYDWYSSTRTSKLLTQYLGKKKKKKHEYLNAQYTCKCICNV